MKLNADTESYMQLCLNMEGRPLYLIVPTYFDRTKKEWMGYVNLPKCKKTIVGIGKNSKELEQDFNEKLAKSLQDDPEETFSLFKELSYWNEMQ